MFFYGSKLFWMLVQPTTLILILFLGAIALLLLGRRKLGLIAVCTAAATYIAIVYLSIGQWLIAPLENRFPANPQLPDKIAGIIVLAGPIDRNLTRARGQLAIRDGSERYIEFSRLVRQFKHATAIISGGNPSADQHLEHQAVVARRLLDSLGLSDRPILLETESRNTDENIRFTYETVQPEPGSHWIMVTSAYHMPRAMAVARSQRWNLIPYPVDFRTEGSRGRFFGALDHGEAFTLADLAIKEWLGLLAYYLAGKSAVLWP